MKEETFEKIVEYGEIEDFAIVLMIFSSFVILLSLLGSIMNQSEHARIMAMIGLFGLIMGMLLAWLTARLNGKVYWRKVK